jgi:ankyrin repeat protein
MHLGPEETQRVVELAMDLARHGETAQLSEFLDHGLPADTQDAQGNSLLMLAAYSGHTDTVGMLVERGANIDLRNDRDQSPIAGALFKGETNVVSLLKSLGADLDAGTPTARQAAEMFGQEL